MTTAMQARPCTPLRQYLFDLTLHGIKLGLENIQALCHAAGDPHLAYPVVHVGGTNGKGSTVALLAAMLGGAGYRVGRFTSPHLIDVSERFLINGVPIPEPALEENIAFFRDVCTRLERIPTFFEMNTAIAFRYFAQQAVDIAVIEVGMGGRFDSTNIVSPIATGITNIDLEHTAFLGDTIAKIAFEKAGIIKPGVPVSTTEIQPDALAVFRQRAAEVGAPLRELRRDVDYELEGNAWRQRFSYTGRQTRLNAVPLSLAGGYQGANAALAVALADDISPSFPALTPGRIESGLASATWPCRAEKVLDDPPVFIDVAHNAAGARRIAELFDDCVVVFSASSDKDARAMLAALRPRARHLILSQFVGKRATPVDVLREQAGDAPVEVCVPIAEAVARGLALASDGCPLLITGSVYTAGEARELLISRYGGKALQF